MKLKIGLLLTTLIIILVATKNMQSKEATFYADKYIGRKMANGELFNQEKLTCASNDYPLGTLLHVEYKGKFTIVTVTDRIGYGTDIDLTKLAFEELAPLHIGRLKGIKIKKL